MSELRVSGILQDRYNTRFQGILHKLVRSAAGTVCSYSNNLATRPANSSMHRPLKLKIQDAISQVILCDAESRGIFVGGRRRNRKKRRTRHVKDKKKPKKCDGKCSPVLGKCNNDPLVVPADERPLIESDFDSTLSLAITNNLHYVDDLPPLVDTEDQEIQDPDEMPFGFLKSKFKGNTKKDVVLEAEVKETESPVTEEPPPGTENLLENNHVGTHTEEEIANTAETQTTKDHVHVPEAEDATDIATLKEEPAGLETEGGVSASEPLVEIVEDMVLQPNTAYLAEEVEEQAEEDDHDGTPGGKAAIAEQVITEVKDEQPKTVNDKKVEESSPLIMKQEEAVDDSFMCCVIL